MIISYPTKEGIILFSEIMLDAGLSLFTSLLYDVVKKVVLITKDTVLEANKEKKRIEQIFAENISNEDRDIIESSAFSRFIQCPSVHDYIDQYVSSRIYGFCEQNNVGTREKNQITDKKFLGGIEASLKSFYNTASIVTPPSDMQIAGFAKRFHTVIVKYIHSFMDSKSNAEVFLVNHHIDSNTEIILERMDEIANKWMEAMEVADYRNIRDEYLSNIKQNFIKANVYLMSTLNLNDFFVCPKLVFLDPQRIKRLFGLTVGEVFSEHLYRFLPKKNWMNIFETNNIVYIIGGAGYGKSLFLKFLIGNHEKINMIDADQYLLIYGELRQLCHNDYSNPKSVLDFLQDSMVLYSGMDREQISKEMISTYLKQGRCLVLLDALDEVPKDQRNELHRKIITYFSNENPNNKICITSRARGFIPEEKPYPLHLLPLTMKQVEEYVDKMILLDRFESKQKDSFLQQASSLINNGFLGSFLILSLLISIYKAENELPDTKLELYQKCFEYIARKREKEKNTKYNWNIMQSLLRDNAFMELAKLCSPNNAPVSRDVVSDQLLDIYADEYVDRNEARNAIGEFLDFCSERTEVFVPAAEEDTFKFFHRSFYEYFYSKYIVLRSKSVETIYETLIKTDLDSEVFELVVAMLKNDDMVKCNELITMCCEKMDEKFSNGETECIEYYILVIVMPYITNLKLIKRFVQSLCNNSQIISNQKHLFVDYNALVKAIYRDEELTHDIVESYTEKAYANLLEMISRFMKMINHLNQEQGNEVFVEGWYKEFEHRIIAGLEFYTQVMILQDPEGLCGLLNKMKKTWLKKQYRDSKTGRREYKLAEGYVSQAIYILNNSKANTSSKAKKE